MHSFSRAAEHGDLVPEKKSEKVRGHGQRSRGHSHWAALEMELDRAANGANPEMEQEPHDGPPPVHFIMHYFWGRYCWATSQYQSC